MPNHRKDRGLDTETKIVLALIAVFLFSAVASYAVGSPILTAVCAGLIVTALLYRFLGGVEGSTLTRISDLAMVLLPIRVVAMP